MGAVCSDSKMKKKRKRKRKKKNNNIPPFLLAPFKMDSPITPEGIAALRSFVSFGIERKLVEDGTEDLGKNEKKK